MFCTTCGAKLDDGARFCTSCGATIETPRPPRPARPAQGNAAPAPAVPASADASAPAPVPTPVADDGPTIDGPTLGSHDVDGPTIDGATRDTAVPAQPQPAAAPTAGFDDLDGPTVDASPAAETTETTEAAQPHHFDFQTAQHAAVPQQTTPQAQTPHTQTPVQATQPIAAPVAPTQTWATPAQPVVQPTVQMQSAQPAPAFAPQDINLESVATPVGPADDPYGFGAGTATATAPRKSHRGLIALLCLLILLAASLVTAFFTLRATVFAPDGTIRDYVNAVSSGDFTKANELANPGIDNAKRALLLPDVAKDQANRIHDVSVGEPVKTGSAYTATVDYTVNGEKQSSHVTVTPAGKQWLVFDTWKVTTPMIETINVALPQSMHHISVNGVDVDLTKVGNGTSVNAAPTTASNYDSSFDYTSMKMYELAAYPGVYQFSTSDSTYVTTKPVTITKPDDTAWLLPQQTAKLKQALLDAVNKQMQPCLASTALTPPDGCKYAVDMSDSSSMAKLNTTMHRSLKDPVTIDEIDLAHGTFSTGQFQILGDYQYRWLDTDPWTDAQAYTIVTLTGTFSLDNEQLTVNVDPGK